LGEFVFLAYHSYYYIKVFRKKRLKFLKPSNGHGLFDFNYYTCLGNGLFKIVTSYIACSLVPHWLDSLKSMGTGDNSSLFIMMKVIVQHFLRLWLHSILSCWFWFSHNWYLIIFHKVVLEVTLDEYAWNKIIHHLKGLLTKKLNNNNNNNKWCYFDTKWCLSFGSYSWVANVVWLWTTIFYLFVDASSNMVMKEDLIFLHGGKQLLQHTSLLRKLGLEGFFC